MSKFSRLFSLLALLVAVVLVINIIPTAIKSYFLEPKLQNNQPKLTASWQFFHLTNWQITDKNKPSEQTFLQADKVSYQNDTETSHLTGLKLIISKPKQTILIQSNLAKSEQDQLLTLSEQVKIEILKSKTSSILKTAQITYNSKTKHLQSDVHTKLTNPEFIISGDRFSGNIKMGEYRFTGNVKSKLIFKDN